MCSHKKIQYGEHEYIGNIAYKSYALKKLCSPSILYCIYSIAFEIKSFELITTESFACRYGGSVSKYFD